MRAGVGGGHVHLEAGKGIARRWAAVRPDGLGLAMIALYASPSAGAFRFRAFLRRGHSEANAWVTDVHARRTSVRSCTESSSSHQARWIFSNNSALDVSMHARS